MNDNISVKLFGNTFVFNSKYDETLKKAMKFSYLISEKQRMKLWLGNFQGLELKCYYVGLYASGYKIVLLQLPPKQVYFLLCFVDHHCLHNTK